MTTYVQVMRPVQFSSVFFSQKQTTLLLFPPSSNPHRPLLIHTTPRQKQTQLHNKRLHCNKLILKLPYPSSILGLFVALLQTSHPYGTDFLTTVAIPSTIGDTFRRYVRPHVGLSTQLLFSQRCHEAFFPLSPTK